MRLAIIIAFCCITFTAPARSLYISGNIGASIANEPGGGAYASLKLLKDSRIFTWGGGVDYLNSITTSPLPSLIRGNDTRNTKNIIPNIILNAKLPIDGTILYAGLHAGFIMSYARQLYIVRNGNYYGQKEGKYLMSGGISFGGQAGITFRARKKLGINLEIAPRVAKIADGPSFVYLPVSFGVRYRI